MVVPVAAGVVAGFLIVGAFGMFVTMFIISVGVKKVNVFARQQNPPENEKDEIDKKKD